MGHWRASLALMLIYINAKAAFCAHLLMLCVCVWVCVFSALIWCLNKWLLPPGVSLQCITAATMEPPLSPSLGTSRLPAHAWPCGKCGLVNNTDTLNDVCTPTYTQDAHTVIQHKLFILFSFLDILTLFFFGTFCEPAVSLHLSPLQIPLPKVSCLTVALSILLYSEAFKAGHREYWEDLGEIHFGWTDVNRTGGR